MADRAKKVSELTSLTAASGDDLLLIVDDPLGTPATKKITVDAFFSGSVAANGAFANIEITDTATVNNAIIANVAIANVAITDTSIANAVITDTSITNAVITDTTITTENVITSTISTLTVNSTTVLNGLTTVSNFTGSNIILNNEQTPTSNPLPGVNRGTFFWDENYLYIAFSDSHIKRVALESFFFLSGTLFENENEFFTGSIATV